MAVLIPEANRSALSPEDCLILLLSRGKLSPRGWEQALALLSSRLNWDLILEQARVQEVYPIFYRNLGTLGFHVVPDHARIALEALCKINAFRNAHLVEELARVFALLGDADIPTIPLKGVALAQSLYADSSLRVCVDIDILVPREMVIRALQLLLAEGYESEPMPGFFADLVLRYGKEYALTRRDNGFRYLLDFHWGILWGGKSERRVMEEVWVNAYPTTVFGAPAYTLCREWQLLLLAAHAARHQWQGLKWLVDIHDLCSTGEIEWEKMIRGAKRLGWEEMLRLTLHTCRALLDTPIPPNYSVGEFPPGLKLFPAAPANRRKTFFPIRLLRRPSEKFCYVTRVFLVPTLAECRLLRLPHWLSLLYYLLRPLRLGHKWSWSLLRASFGKLSFSGATGRR